jgi:hypothetical protein
MWTERVYPGLYVFSLSYLVGPLVGVPVDSAHIIDLVAAIPTSFVLCSLYTYAIGTDGAGRQAQGRRQGRSWRVFLVPHVCSTDGPRSGLCSSTNPGSTVFAISPGTWATVRNDTPRKTQNSADTSHLPFDSARCQACVDGWLHGDWGYCSCDGDHSCHVEKMGTRNRLNGIRSHFAQIFRDHKPRPRAVPCGPCADLESPSRGPRNVTFCAR